MSHDARSDEPMDRRRAIITGLTAAGTLLLPGCAGDAPPTYGSILRMGDNLTWRAQRLLVTRTARVKEYGVRDIPLPHGAPVRVRVATQLGWKSVKFLRRIEVLDRFEDNGRHGEIQNGWAWYGGI